MIETDPLFETFTFDSTLTRMLAREICIRLIKIDFEKSSRNSYSFKTRRMCKECILMDQRAIGCEGEWLIQMVHDYPHYQCLILVVLNHQVLLPNCYFMNDSQLQERPWKLCRTGLKFSAVYIVI